MASGATGPDALVRSAVDREAMGEVGGLPGRGGVAVLAGGWETSCPVIGITYRVVDRLVTGEAIGWCSSIAAIDVTGGAGHRGVLSS